MIMAEKYITPVIVSTFATDIDTTTLAVYIVSFIIVLLFGEISAKIVGVRFNDTVALWSAPIYQVLVWILTPVSYCIEFFVRFLGWATGGRLDMHGHGVTEAEVEAFIDMSHRDGAVEADERRQIKNLLALSDITAESVMTPRVYVEFLSLDMTIDEACTFFVRTTHSRIPVYGETTDDIDYLITFREAFKLQREGHGSINLSAMNLEKIMKVPLTQALDDLFEKFQKSRRHIALVLDEHGGTAGVVTMEDVLEEVFGDIKDEKDKEEIYMRKRTNGNIEAVGTVLIDDILEEYNISPADIALPSIYQSEPLSYILLAEKEEFVHVGTSICFAGDHMSLTITILSTDEMVIEKVLCEKVDTNK
jgi:CBS domain containing-hemolysin-like protein